MDLKVRKYEECKVREKDANSGIYKDAAAKLAAIYASTDCIGSVDVTDPDNKVLKMPEDITIASAASMKKVETKYFKILADYTAKYEESSLQERVKTEAFIKKDHEEKINARLVNYYTALAADTAASTWETQAELQTRINLWFELQERQKAEDVNAAAKKLMQTSQKSQLDAESVLDKDTIEKNKKDNIYILIKKAHEASIIRVREKNAVRDHR